MSRSSARTLLLLFALGLAARLGWGLFAGLGGPPVEDERGYALLARSLAAVGRFELPLPEEFGEVPPRTSFRAPLVPLLLAPLSAAGLDVTAFRVAAVLAGSLAAPLAWIGLRRTMLGTFAIWPAAALAVWPPSVHLSARILSEPFAATLLLAALAVPPGDSARKAAPRGAWSGLLAGLAVLARPAALPAALALALLRGGGRFAAGHLVVLVLVLAPWVARNVRIHDRPLLTTNTGATLLGGNCPASLEAPHPGKWVEPRRAWGSERPDAPDLGIWGWRALSEEASDRRFTESAIAFVRERPTDAARLALWKAVRFLDPDPTSEKSDAPLKRLAGWVSFLPVLALAVPGAWTAASRRGASGLGPWALLLAATFATCLVFYGDTRLRNPADPAFLAFAAVGVRAWVLRRAPSAAGEGPGR